MRDLFQLRTITRIQFYKLIIFLKQLEREKQKQQQQFTQDRLNNEFEKLNESFLILRNQIDNGRNNIGNESVRDANEMNVLIGQNNK